MFVMSLLGEPVGIATHSADRVSLGWPGRNSPSSTERACGEPQRGCRISVTGRTQKDGHLSRAAQCILVTGLVASWTVIAFASDAGPRHEPHLNIVPRTEDEIARIDAVTAPATDFLQPSRFEAKSAGAATVRVRRNANAFSDPSGNVEFEGEMQFKVGNGLFRKLWVSAPSSTMASDGLGPLFNARSCQGCHIKDGRGHPPERSDDRSASFLLRVSVPDGADQFEASPDPTYGLQIQNASLIGHRAEGRIVVSYSMFEVPLSEGESVTLRRPSYSVGNLGYGPLHPGAALSPRVAPQMVGLGLLEAIPAADILERADPEDRDGDGISGRPNVAWSPAHRHRMLGRFGWKAAAATVRDQAAAAFADDIGISSDLFPDPWGECTDVQERCRLAMHGDRDGHDEHEISSEGLELVTFYSRNLGVPERRSVADPEVLRGKEVFYRTGCISCHHPAFVTHRLVDQPEQSFQLIWPYTDLLLHDMGDGLADSRPEGRATGREWRTAPLWGIGLTERVSGHTYFLHDGRARSLLEAILWHGGEAQPHRDAVVRMPRSDRNALLRFLESL